MAESVFGGRTGGDQARRCGRGQGRQGGFIVQVTRIIGEQHGTGPRIGLPFGIDLQRQLRIDLGQAAQLRQRWQFIDGAQAEVVEELARGTQQLRPPRQFPVAHDAHPAPLQERAHDVRIHRHAAHGLDFGARDGLAVGDQRQRLEQGARIALRALRPQARHFGGELPPHLDAHATGRLLEFERAPGILALERGEAGPDRRGARPFALTEQCGKFFQPERTSGRQQTCFQHVLDVLLVHDRLWGCDGESSATGTSCSVGAGVARRTWSGASASVCTISIRPSRSSSRIATKVTVTPMRPSEGLNRRTKSVNAPGSRAASMLLMRSRTESGSRWMWWCANIWARVATSRKASSISRSATWGSTRATGRSRSTALAWNTSRSSRASWSTSLAARLKRSYSCSRRTSSARGSSSPSALSSERGSSMRDLISARVAAITRYSPA